MMANHHAYSGHAYSTGHEQSNGTRFGTEEIFMGPIVRPLVLKDHNTLQLEHLD